MRLYNLAKVDKIHIFSKGDALDFDKSGKCQDGSEEECLKSSWLFHRVIVVGLLLIRLFVQEVIR